jgi:predicted permease
MKLRLRSRVATWWHAMRHRSSFEQQMSEEMAFHLESYQADLIAQGLDPAAARRRARLEFGSASAAVEERCRDAYGLRLWDDLVADLRYALRQFRHNPGFTATVIVVLALGIGANAAMFTVISQTLLRRLPYGHANQIVTLTAADKAAGPTVTSQSDLLAWRQSRTIAEMLPYSQQLGWLAAKHSLTNVGHHLVGANFCGFLRTAPQLGRCFTESDVDGQHGAVLLLSDNLWRTIYGADPKILGTVTSIDQHSYTIIGVMQRGFDLPLNQRELQAWSPAPLRPLPPDDKDNVGFGNVLARLRSGVTLAQAHAELSVIQHGQAAQHVDKVSLEIGPVQVLVKNFRSTLSADARPALLALLAAVLTLWLIACLNVANLLLARGVGRQRELAIRGALGAGRWRIVRQLLLESVLLSFIGSTIGLALAEVTLLAFGKMLHTRLHLPPHPLPDVRVLSALLALSILSALLFGLAPALIASRTTGERSLRQQSSAAPGRGHLRLQHTLVACEVACTVVLLVSCGLLLRTVFALRNVPLGFRTDHVALVHPDLPGYKYDKADMQQALYGPLLEHIRAIHGVESAALTTVAPLSRGDDVEFFMFLGEQENGPTTRRVQMRLHADGRDLQKVLGFRMRQGRFFNTEDTRTSQPVAIVNRAFIQLWKTSGKSLDEFTLSLNKKSGRKLRIVGVMDDVRQISVGAPAAPELDLCADQLLPTDTFYGAVMRDYSEIAIRTTVPVEQIAPDIRAAMAAVDPALKGSVVETMQQVVNDNIGDQLFAAHLIETFGGCALLVALTGLYGFLAYLVSQRTHDIGVRLALGAQRASIQWMFLARALAMIAAGLVAGVLVSLFATRLVTRFLYGVRPNDLATLVGVVLVILTAGLVAAWLPARRASHVEPMDALRET